MESVIKRCSTADYQLTVALHMLFLYSDAGSHFNRNKIPHKMTCDLVPVKAGRLIQVKISKKDRLTEDWSWLLNRGGR